MACQKSSILLKYFSYNNEKYFNKGAIILAKSKIDNFSKEELQAIINSSNSYREILEKLGYCKSGASLNTLKKKCQNLNIDLSNFPKKVNQGLPLSLEAFTINSSHSTTTIKKYILKHNLLKYECEKCGNKGEWQGMELVLQLDHKNGDNTDNRLENLRFLCPNCHAQTTTFSRRKNVETKKFFCTDCGKEVSYGAKKCPECFQQGQRTTIRPSRDELKNLIRTTPFTQIGKMYNVSDNAIRKWCDSYNLPRKSSDIKKYTDEDWLNI